MNKKILFLGYKYKKTRLIKFLKNKGYRVFQHGNANLTQNLIKNNFELILSFGYKKIVKQKIISQLNRPIINLHMSYLPYNKGADPNLWSFIDNTPKGISIHEIDTGVDTGPIIIRKKVLFNNVENKTLRTTYLILFKEIEKLFMKNFKLILNNQYKKIKYKSKGTYHSKKDFPKEIKSWDIKIKNLKQSF